MAIYNEDFVRVDLNAVVRSTYISRLIGEGDSKGDRIGIHAFRNGEEVSLAGGSCVGYFTRPDGITLIIGGSVSGNSAYVDLPQAAYAVEGAFTLAVKITDAGVTNTVRMVVGVVVNTTEEAVADPAQLIPDLADYIEYAEQAEAAAETIAGLSVSATQIEGTRYKIAVTKS